MACIDVAAFLQTAGAIIFQIFSSRCHYSLMFAARQIANNLSPIAKQFHLFFMVLRIILLERTSNNLARAFQFFLCLIFARFALLKTGFSS